MFIIKNIPAFIPVVFVGIFQTNKDTNVRDNKNLELNTSIFGSYISPCHPANEVNRVIIENFIAGSDWSSERQNLGVTGITTAQIERSFRNK